MLRPAEPAGLSIAAKLYDPAGEVRRLTGDLGGMHAATIDTAGAKLAPSPPMGLTLTGDGPTTVTLSGLTEGRTLNTTPTTLTVIPSTS